MGSYGMCGGISQEVRYAVMKINNVGVGRLKRYCKEKHPRMDFDRAISIIRCIAKYGYAEAARQFDISRNYAHSVLKRYAKVAAEVEKDG